MSTIGGLGISDFVGIIVGGVLGLATVIGLCITIYAMCGKKNEPKVAPQPYQQNPYGPYGQPTNTGYHHPPGPNQQQPQWNQQQPQWNQQQPQWNQQQPQWNQQQPQWNQQTAQDKPPAYNAAYPAANMYGKT